MSGIEVRRHSVGPRRAQVDAPSSTEPVIIAGPGHLTMCSCELEIAPGPAGPILVLRVAGEIDLNTLSVLEHALADAIDQRPTDLVVDLAGVGFCCIRAIDLLTTAATTMPNEMTTYSLSGLSPHLERISTLLWPDEPFLRYRSAASAVTALRIEQAYRPT